MTINALGGSAPRFSSTLRCHIAEMVTRRPEAITLDTEGCNELGDLLPFVHYVDDGLSLFKESIKSFEDHRALLLESRNLYHLVFTNRAVENEKSSALTMATLALNHLRTSFADQLCNNSPLVQERLNAVKTLSQDLPELIFATSQFSSSYSHPAIDDTDDVINQVREQLGLLTGNFYHRQFYRHCLHFPRQTNFGSLIPPVENDIVPTMGTEYCWPIGFYQLDVLSTLNSAIDPYVVEGTKENLEQCLSLRFLTLRPSDVKKKQREEFPKLLQAWQHVVEQVRLLLHITDVLIPVLDAATSVIWLHLEHCLEKGNDAGLDAIVDAKLTPLLDRVNQNE